MHSYTQPTTQAYKHKHTRYHIHPCRQKNYVLVILQSEAKNATNRVNNDVYPSAINKKPDVAQNKGTKMKEQ
jgi:hypothetical protein